MENGDWTVGTGSSNVSVNTFGARRRQKWGVEKIHAGDPGAMAVAVFTFLIDAEHFNLAN